MCCAKGGWEGGGGWSGGWRVSGRTWEVELDVVEGCCEESVENGLLYAAQSAVSGDKGGRLACRA